MKTINSKTQSIIIIESRLAAILGLGCFGLPLWMMLDHKFGAQTFNLQANISDTVIWAVIIGASTCCLLMIRQMLNPRQTICIDQEGLIISQRRLSHTIHWYQVTDIQPTKVRLLGRHTYNKETKQNEPLLIDGVKLILTESYKECGSYPHAFVRGNELFITDTSYNQDELIQKIEAFMLNA